MQRTAIAFLLLVAGPLAATVLAQGPQPLGPPPTPPGNPITAAKVNLGKALFWDEQMSSNRTVACGTCHITQAGGSDPRTSAANPASRHPGPDGVFLTPDDRRGSPGTSLIDATGKFILDPAFRLQPQVTGRKAPSTLNAAYVPSMFWDGRATPTFRDPLTNAIVLNAGAALESQAVEPPLSTAEMGHVGRDWNAVAAQIAASRPLRLSPSIPAALAAWINGRDYPGLFLEAFGTPDVTPARIALAIATYERVLWTGQAPIDSFFGGNPGALTPQENAGLQVFNTQGRCNTCHVGNRFTNDQFRYIGVRPDNDDVGRFAVTGNPGDRGRMKVPTLRNVELRAPYFHNGGMATLEDVIDFYNRGGDFNGPNKDPNIVPLGLNATQRANLAAFLRRPLTDPRVAAQTAPFDRPLLASEAAPAPSSFGAGTPGTGGFVPQMVAVEPPYVGNPRFTLAVDRGNAGRQGILVVSETSTPPTAFQGATLYVPTGGPITVRRVPITGAGPGEGVASASVAIPDNPVLVGTTFYAQWVSLDLTPAGRLSASAPVACVRF